MIRIIFLEKLQNKTQNPSTYGHHVFVDYKNPIIFAIGIISYSPLLSSNKAIDQLNIENCCLL